MPLDLDLDTLSNDVGPLPVWGWGLIGGVGIGAYYWWSRRSTGTVSEPAEPGADSDGDGTLDRLAATPSSPFLPGGFVIGGGPAQGTGSTGGLDPADQYEPPEPQTNDDWERQASRYLVARGNQGTIVTDALGRYLSGRMLTRQGQAMIDLAISALGAPPQPVPPPTVTPQPEPTPSPGGGGTTPRPRPRPPTPTTVTPQPEPTPKLPGRKPPKATRLPAEPSAPVPAPAPAVVTVTVKSGDTLSGIIRRQWGRSPTLTEVYGISAANGITNANLIIPGQKIIISRNAP